MSQLNRGIWVVAAMIAGSAVSANPTTSTPRAQPLPLAFAEQMIGECFQLSVAEKFPPLSAVIIDLSGTMIAFRRQDGASPVSSDAALLKARTALRARLASATLGRIAAKDPLILDIMTQLQLTGVGGGVLVESTAGDAIGAVGVSGGAPAEDEHCANVAAAAKRTSK